MSNVQVTKKEDSEYGFYNRERKRNMRKVSKFMRKIQIERRRERLKKNAKGK